MVAPQSYPAHSRAPLLQQDSDRVILLGHSAGGWLARAYLADTERYAIPTAGDGDVETRGDGARGAEGEDLPLAHVAGLVSLGTPHSGPPVESGVRDMTGGAVAWVDRTWPGAFFKDKGVAYVAVAGRAVR